MKKFLWFILICGLVLNKYDRTKRHYLYTFDDHNYPQSKSSIKLHREYYLYYRGYMTTDINSVYLTDSVNFRLFLGSYDQGDEFINTRYNGDTLYVEKISNTSNEQQWNIPKVIERKAYSLKALKQHHVFE